MFDFRYHALSLIAVFVALVLGLLLGVAIGDKGLVSSAENKVKESLRADVRSEQKKAADLSDTVAQQDKFAQEVYPLLVDGQLQDRKIGVVFLGQSSDEINNEVENALNTSGGKRLGNERHALFSAVAGSTGPYDGVVIARNPPDGIKGEDLHRLNSFEQGLVKGLASRNVPVVGVEHADNDKTQVPWFRDQGLS